MSICKILECFPHKNVYFHNSRNKNDDKQFSALKQISGPNCSAPDNASCARVLASFPESWVVAVPIQPRSFYDSHDHVTEIKHLQAISWRFPDFLLFIVLYLDLFKIISLTAISAMSSCCTTNTTSPIDMGHNVPHQEPDGPWAWRHCKIQWTKVISQYGSTAFTIHLHYNNWLRNLVSFGPCWSPGNLQCVAPSYGQQNCSWIFLLVPHYIMGPWFHPQMNE